MGEVLRETKDLNIAQGNKNHNIIHKYNIIFVVFTALDVIFS